MRPAVAAKNSHEFPLMSQVIVDNVRKQYGNGFEAIKGVSLSIENGEFATLVGPSGCGKSTLLRMIAGLESVTGGEIRIADRVVNDVSPRERGIAMVFQNYALYPHMTVAKNMGFALRQARLPKDEIDERVTRAAEILGLVDLLDRKPKQLSGGQRQRVAVGRAIVRDADVFLFDEPLSNLDASLRTQMRTEIAKLHKRLGKTMIYVTHDQVEAMTMADRIIVLKGGQVVQADAPLSLYHAPKNDFVATFIGSPAMNLLNASVEAIRNDTAALRIEGCESTIALTAADTHRFDWTGVDAIRLGVRPEDVLLTEESDCGPGTFEIEVDLIEPMGNEVIVHGHLVESRQAIVLRGPMDSLPSIGEKRRVWLRDLRVTIFDANSGNSLARP